MLGTHVLVGRIDFACNGCHRKSHLRRWPSIGGIFAKLMVSSILSFYLWYKLKPVHWDDAGEQRHIIRHECSVRISTYSRLAI